MRSESGYRVRRLAIVLFLAAHVTPVSSASPQQSSARLVESAKAALRSQDTSAALRLFQKAVERDPDNGEAHYYLAQLYARVDEERLALQHFDAALERLPRQQVIWREYGQWLLSNRYIEEAIRAHRRLVALAPENPAYRMSLARALYEGGNAAEALEVCRKGLELGASSAADHYLTAVAARALGDPETAFLHLEKGLSKEPSDVELRFQMGELLLQTGRVGESLRHWNRLPLDQARFRFGLGLALLRTGASDEAEKHFRQVIKIEPEHVQATYQLGLIFARSGRKQLAEEYLERFRQLEKLRRENQRTQVTKTVVRN